MGGGGYGGTVWGVRGVEQESMEQARVEGVFDRVSGGMYLSKSSKYEPFGEEGIKASKPKSGRTMFLVSTKTSTNTTMNLSENWSVCREGHSS